MGDNDYQTTKKFRGVLRKFEREIFMLNSDSCCNGITLAQCHTLLEIEHKEKESVTELAKTLGLDKSTVSRTVDGLVNNGLLDRTIPAENRRMSTLQLTDAGKDICNTINCTNDKYFEDTLSVLSDPEQKELIRLLEKVTSRMGELRSNNNCCK
ncbi:MAG TPA: MarR family winged helix-turn-helix transcriptional regulator [Bacteroidales bacterium]|nr:MarR family winged helix-turn-helix transcriptional regulator [Bacteroidales bacterium]